MSRPTSEIKAIPRRIVISDPSDISGSYSSTPGGTLFSTTPGGTKIVYERAFLMNLRNSPISKTPPNWEIPNSIALNGNRNEKKTLPTKKSKPIKQITRSTNGFRDDHEQFQLEM
ncbi:hypothetical protein PPYR_12718 [Photinus pyralis]|uniref:Uncharacterized protein n=1 Tax=Photinus pyralis TaxID=7054 RepID=A0A1Y1LGV8_PHOPY|nr:eukaryotic translation initiation factor 4E-binding protein 1 [Photinus pyralis]KAB0793098.1 hypothetical protein PPYR_12718 [Photinus pyralis]